MGQPIEFNDLADGKKRYIAKTGNMVYMIKSKNKNCLEAVPEGWKILTLPSGHLKIVPERN